MYVLGAQKIPAGLCCLAVVRKAEKGSVSLYLPHGLHAVAKAADVNPVAGMLCLPGAKSAESDSDSDASDDDERVVTELSPSGLSALLVPGQYVSCVVLRTPEAAAGQAATEGSKAPPLSVSMHPTLVNDGLDFSHLTKDVAAIWGFVVSKEDHGFVVELGVSGVHAFLPFKNVVGGPASLLAGSPAFFSITAVKTSAHSVVLSYDPSKRDHVSTSSAALSLTSLKPGTLVNATVKKVFPPNCRILCNVHWFLRDH